MADDKTKKEDPNPHGYWLHEISGRSYWGLPVFSPLQGPCVKITKEEHDTVKPERYDVLSKYFPKTYPPKPKKQEDPKVVSAVEKLEKVLNEVGSDGLVDVNVIKKVDEAQKEIGELQKKAVEENEVIVVAEQKVLGVDMAQEESKSAVVTTQVVDGQVKVLNEEAEKTPDCVKMMGAIFDALDLPKPVIDLTGQNEVKDAEAKVVEDDILVIPVGNTAIVEAVPKEMTEALLKVQVPKELLGGGESSYGSQKSAT